MPPLSEREEMTERDIVIVGGGGHARVLIETLLALDRSIIGYVDPKPGCGPIFAVPCLGGDEVLEGFDPPAIQLVNGIGGAAGSRTRRAMYSKLSGLGFEFARIVHPSAYVARGVLLAPGAQVLSGAVVGPFSTIGANSIINTRASVDHDCQISAHVHIGPGATLCGGVVVEEGAYVGAGATIIEGRRLGVDCIIGAGAVVITDAPASKKLLGIPARAVAQN